MAVPNIKILFWMNLIYVLTINFACCRRNFRSYFFAWSVKWWVSLKLWSNHWRDWINNFPSIWKSTGRNSLLLKMDIALKFTETYNKNWLFVYSQRIITFNLKLNFLAYSCLISWQIQKTTHSTCERHTSFIICCFFMSSVTF